MLFELSPGRVIPSETTVSLPGSNGDHNAGVHAALYLHGYTQPAPTATAPLSLPHWGCASQALTSEGARLEILTDHAGAYPLYEARAASGNVVIGSDAWEVARKAGLSTLNHAACFDLMAFEYVPGFETLIEGLTEIPPATRLIFQWAKDNWERREETVWKLERRINDSVSIDDAFNNLMDLVRPVETAFANLNDDARNSLAINLSGGWDSRAIIAAANKIDMPPMLACSYGNPDYPGVKIAGKVATALGIEHKLYAFTDASFLRDNYSNLCANTPSTTRFNLADGAMAMGENLYGNCRAIMCGHSGDVFTGLPDVETISRQRTPDKLASWLQSNTRSAFADKSLHRLLKPAVAADVCHQIRQRLRQTVDPVFAPGSEGYFRWKLQNRVRRAVAVELRMLERYAETVYVPMLDRTFLEFWMTVPDDQLRNQQFYRRMLATKLFTGQEAALANIPRETGTHLSPDAPLAGLRDSARDNYLRVLRRVSPSSSAIKTAADPTALWWQTDTALRQWAWEILADSPFVREYFQMDQLRKLVNDPKPSDPSFARIGIWNLITIPGTERENALPSP